MREPDYEAVAALLAERGRVRPGEQVLICTHTAGLPLAEALYLRCYRVGAVPLIMTSHEELQIRALKETGVDVLKQQPRHLAATYGNTDIIFYLYSQLQNPALAAAVPMEKIGASGEGRRIIQDIVYDGKRRVVITDFPTPAQAAFYGVDFESYHDAFWNSLLIDYEALQRQTAKLAEKLRGHHEVRVVSSKGTDVRLRIRDRAVQRDDGTIGFPGEPGADLILNLPTGEVCVAPQEDGAEGVAVFDFTFIAGERVNDLEVHFSRGQGRLVKAASGFQRAADFFAVATGNPYGIAELGLGVNPVLTEPFGSILMDEKIAGSVHLALGDNRSFGGTNVSNVHQDMIILNPTVYCDGEVIVDKGKINT